MELDKKPNDEELIEKTDVESSGAIKEQPTNKKSKKLNKKQLIITIVVSSVVIIGGLTYLFVLKDKNSSPAVNQQAQNTEKVTQQEKIPTELEKQIARLKTPTTGETWLATPKEIPLQGFLSTANNPEDAEYTKYYEVGKRGENTIILSEMLVIGSYTLLYEKTPAGKVTAIMHPDANATYSSDFDKQTQNLNTSVTPDFEQHYDSLSIPTELSIGNSESVTAPKYPSLGTLDDDPTVSTTTIMQYGSSKLIKNERKYADTGLTAVSYKFINQLGRSVTMAYEPLVTELSDIKWTIGDNVSGKFGGIVRGCGAGVSVSRGDNVTDSDFVKAGTTSTGQVVYHFASNNATLVQKAWQETKDFYDGADSTKSKITIEEFIKNQAIFAYKDANNGWLIYTSDAYAPIGGCAKPVVYLYPTTPQQISVKVGADVKISDPLYNPKTGWQAFAWPSGQLIVGGKIYDSLFWEGPGHGEYPGITTGTVVKRSEVVATMRLQLKQQGLNTKEINDFIDYWQSRIPNKPYVRLSWFSTSQMDQLAPLYVVPKPTTTIRVFLDMAGSDTYYNMQAPILGAPSRDGFTVVEWGGLSLGKLY